MENRFLDTNEAAKMLKISTSTLYKMVMNKSIPHYKIGNKNLFDEKELVGFVKEKRIGTMVDIVAPSVKI
jgi:excisionase family DNA binding protein